MDIWLRTMSMDDRRDSEVSRPRDEGTGDAGTAEPAQEPSSGSPATELVDGDRTPVHAQEVLGRRPTLGALIGWYAGLIQGSRSRRQGIDRHLVSLAGQPIARKVAKSLTTTVLVQHAQSRRLAGVKPSTIDVDLSLIHTVLEAAKEANIVSIDLKVVGEARTHCRRDGLVGKSDTSGRRITEKELKDLDHYFAREDGRRELPMGDLMEA